MSDSLEGSSHMAAKAGDKFEKVDGGGVNTGDVDAEVQFFGGSTLEDSEQGKEREARRAKTRLKELMSWWNNGTNDFDHSTRSVHSSSIDDLVSGAYPQALQDTRECLRVLKESGMSLEQVKSECGEAIISNPTWFDEDFKNHIENVYNEL